MKMPLLILSVAFLISLTFAKVPSVELNAGCGFHLTTTGNFKGSVGQLADGQARAGGDLAPSVFTWFGDAFADMQSRGCWWTPPTSILQCDRGQQPDHGFEIGCYGGVSYRDQSTFYECQTEDDDEVNIYLRPTGANCSTIMLHADNCQPPCAGQTSSPSPPPTAPVSRTWTPTPFQASTSTTTIPPPIGAPTLTPGQCEVVVARNPDEIILLDKANPDTSYGPNPTKLVEISPNASAIFVFRLASSDAGKQCALVFDLPPPPISGNQTPRYTLTGTGLVEFAILDGPPRDPADTSYNNAPRVAVPLEAVPLDAGMSVEPAAFPCPGVDAEVAVLVGGETGADGCLEYTQDGDGGEDGGDGLVGLYLVVC
ncbi:hypothetical protein M426DRAFT_24486 [Hypoxylon sp. CI-4A]|nr:hypothetical protein M426DRAFT_24486 [Hypoxylon sp. CI-4A]